MNILRWSVVLWCSLGSSALCLAMAPAERQQTFLQAQQAFEEARSAAEYRHSAEMFESLLADGFQSGAVYYNLGNARVRAGELGRAIAAYRRARMYRPRDPYLGANLQHALNVAPGRLPEPPRAWWSHVLFWSDWTSVGEKCYGTAGALLLAAVLASTALLRRWPRLYWLSGGCLALSLALGIDAALAWDSLEHPRRAVVTGETVARKGIGKEYEPAFDQPLKDGAEFTILDENGEWIFGHFAGIGDGWLRNEFVARM
ncbi:MAG: hypothetical protein ACKV0T_13275 [Planctomycetales bacterium]